MGRIAFKKHIRKTLGKEYTEKRTKLTKKVELFFRKKMTEKEFNNLIAVGPADQTAKADFTNFFDSEMMAGTMGVESSGRWKLYVIVAVLAIINIILFILVCKGRPEEGEVRVDEEAPAKDESPK